MFDKGSYSRFFEKVTGRTPYAYQQDLADELVQGNSLVLRAPTGSGKTWAVLAPFLYHQTTKCDAAPPDRLIYALPLRSLASNLHRSTIKRLKELHDPALVVSDYARNRSYLPSDPFYITLQMGGQQDDPFFQGNLTFTTIDQLLSAYILAPVSLPARVGNIGAGGLIGSLIVFDEIHLLDPERSLATAIEMLDRLKGIAQFVMMTATSPDSVLDWLAQKLGAVNKKLSAEQVLALPSYSVKDRRFSWAPRPLTPDDVVRNHKERTIAIVNSVGRAQSLFRDVCQKAKEVSPVPKVLLLHSRFFPEDRRRWESQLDIYFGPDAAMSNAILISTQVVEAGIDISGDVLLTELAPMSSLIQRAGRVARYERPRNVGRFAVFELPTNSKGQFLLGPYRDHSEAIEATRRVFTRREATLLLDYLRELLWLNEVHGVSDQAALEHLDSLHAHRKLVLRAMDGLDEAASSRLIRDISSVNVVLTNRPESLSFGGWRWPQLLGVSRSALFQLREACATAHDPEWVFKVPDTIQANPSGGLDITWKGCGSPAQAAWLVAVHPAHASYSEAAGLELGQASDAVATPRYTQPPPLPRYSYQREPFLAHARRILNQARRVVAHHAAMLQALARSYPGESVPDLVDLICALHDAGKLQIPWQSEAQRWQGYCDSRAGVRPSVNEPLAHTTYDPERDDANPQLPSLPPHASCGAFSLLDYLHKHFSSETAVTICTAISRHHGAHTRLLNEYEFIPDALRVLQDCLPGNAPRPLCILSAAARVETERFADDYLLQFTEDERCWPLYVGLVRLLRLSDQGSLQEQS